MQPAAGWSALELRAVALDERGRRMFNGLLVMPIQRGDSFQRAVSGAPVKWAIAESCEAACEWLAANPSPTVVVADSTLPDGNWYCVLERLLKLGSDAALLVSAPRGRDVSAILEHGIAGVVGRPFDADAKAILDDVLNVDRDATRRKPRKVDARVDD